MTILCTIDLETREVSLPAGQVIASYDHNVDVIRFQAETIPGFSLDTSTIRIAAQGPNKARHDYAVDPSTVQIEEETGYITFDWPIPQGVTEMPIGAFKYGDKGQLIFAVCAEIIDGYTVSKAWHSDDGIITVVAHLEPESGGGEDPEEEATNRQKIAQLQTATAILQREISGIASGTPPTADSTDDMDHDVSTVYINTTDGKWYYWDGTAFQPGGTYGGAVTDTTLAISGAAADAKAVGDALAEKADDSDVTALGTRVDSIKEALFKTDEYSESVTVPIAVGDYRHSTTILEYTVPANQEFTIRMSTDATHGNLNLNADFSDGTYTVLSNNLADDTDLTYTRDKEIVRFKLYTANGFTSAGTLDFSVRYEIQNENSIEEQIENIEEQIENIDTSDVTALGTRVTAVEGTVDTFDGRVETLEEKLYKTVTHEESVTKAIAVGDYRQSTTVLEHTVPANREFTLHLSTDATHGNLNLNADFSDGTYTVLSNNLAADTDLTYIRDKEIVRFKLYTANGFTGAGTLSFSVSYTKQNENSIEKQIEVVDARVDSMGETIADKIPESTMEYLDLENIPASANRINPDNFIHGKQINWAYGQVTDAPTVALYYLPVQPEDTVYFWRLHDGDVMSAHSDGIAVFDESGAFITRGGIAGHQHSYTVPANVYKLGLNITESHLADGDKYIAIFNDSDNPEEYEPYREANDAYFATNEFLKDVDFNSILPNACKLPEAGFIRSVGHGGLSKYYPFDTEWGIIGAKKAGLTQVESDIQITADGVYVLYHDADLRRVGGTQQQTIASMTYAQLNEQFDFGAWFSPRFAGTELCTLDKAVRLCRELGLDIWLDCKTITTTAEIAGAGAILDKWGMLDHAYWVNGNFANVWSVYPNARVVFPSGSKLTGSTWGDADTGWFASFNGNFPSDKKQFVDGMPVVPEGVWFGISQNYQLMNDANYGIKGLYHESELARERNIKYGFYAVDDVNIIAQLSEAVPYQQYLTSNAISYQNAMNAHYGINLADYNLDV